MKKFPLMGSAIAVGMVLLLALPLLANSPASTRQVPPPYGGTGLAKNVGKALANLPYYTVFDNLNYSVAGTAVTLSGQVTTPFLKSDAGSLVKEVKGVTKVDNQVEVLPDSPLDNRIRHGVFRAIYSQGSPLFHYGVGGNKLIHIIVKNGNITLVGEVSSLADKQIAYMRANQVPDAFSVTNDLQVVPKAG